MKFKVTKLINDTGVTYVVGEEKAPVVMGEGTYEFFEKMTLEEGIEIEITEVDNRHSIMLL